MEFQADEKYVKVHGRTLVIDGVRYINYSASAIEFTFTGTKAEAVLTSDFKYEEWSKYQFAAQAAVLVNGEMTRRFMLTDSEKTYTLFESEQPQTVTVKLVKMSEAAFGKVGIKKLIVEGTTPVPTPKKQRRIEFDGDSITCGYGIEGVYNVDQFCTEQENPLTNYAGILTRELDADANYVSWSGIGVISRWVPETEDKPLDDWLFPMIYPCTDAGYSNDLKQQPFEQWDFSRFQPDVVVLFLGTNDLSYTRHIDERVNHFGTEYGRLLDYIMEKNPTAQIFCTLGVMGQDLCEEIEKQVKLKNSDRVHYVQLDVQKDEDGIGADWHPSEKSHQKVAAKLKEEICRVMNW